MLTANDGVTFVRRGALAAGCVLAEIYVGYSITRGSTVTIGAALMAVLIPLFILSPPTVAAFALPTSVAVWRLNAGGLDLSFADFGLVLGWVACIPLAAWRSPAFRQLGIIASGYLMLLAVTVAANPTLRAALEWLHRLHFLIGALIVGSAIARAGKARFALRMYIAAALGIALSALVFSLTHGFEPAYPLGIQKNAAGFLIVAALIICLVAKDVLQIPLAFNAPLQLALLGGVLACQSRGSAATFAVVLFSNALRSKRKSLVPILGVLALLGMIWTATSRELSSEGNSDFKPLGSREIVYANTIDLWRESPIFGLGLRYWRDEATQRDHTAALEEPHNLILSALGESGLVGGAAVLGLNAALVFALRGRRDPLGQVAYYLVIARFIAGLADIYWVAGAGTLPWLVLGLSAATSDSGETAERVNGSDDPLAQHWLRASEAPN